jgi:murein DD-endopeptidase MepM/ murein hydrolase activator NlpD
MSKPGNERLFPGFHPLGGRTWALLLLAGLALLSACTLSSTVSPSAAPTAVEQACSTPGVNPQPEDCLTPTVNESPDAAPTGTGTLRPSVLPSTHTPLPIKTTSLPPTPPACTAQQCFYSTSLLLARPIAPPGNDQVDVTYRFGSTQGKQRDPHHGVEFLNGSGTPVLASGDGVVVVAGNDKKAPGEASSKATYSPYSNFYGNLVVIKHDLPPAAVQDLPAFPMPVYTLYAHLSEVLVEAGQVVRAGQEIGRVGMSGSATGSHLHFEVRLGENSYAASRNPELWLQPHQTESGLSNGALAVRVLDSQGRPIAATDVVVQRLAGDADRSAVGDVYLSSYEEKALLGQPPYEESFAAGDLPAGWYRISFPHFGLQTKDVQVMPGQVTVATFQF